MKILVTGASGFLGRAVVRAAATAGHHVVALVRPTADVAAMEWSDGVAILRGDLRERANWAAQIRDIDAVVHLAAAPSGDLAQQFAGTVLSTENLLENLDLPNLRRFVHVSSFSVYDYAGASAGTIIDEATPLEPKPDERDAYTITKMLQEKLVTEACMAAGTSHIVLRPGAIYGPGKDWDFGRAMKLGRFDVVFAPLARFRLVFVDNCADAIVSAITAGASGSVLNIVDDDLPTHAGYRTRSRHAGAPVGRAIYVPWLAVATLGMLVRLIDRIAFGGHAKLPEFLAYRRQQARWKPFRYSNKAAKTALEWTPRTTLAQGIGLTLDTGRPLKTRRPDQIS